MEWVKTWNRCETHSHIKMQSAIFHLVKTPLPQENRCPSIFLCLIHVKNHRQPSSKTAGIKNDFLSSLSFFLSIFTFLFSFHFSWAANRVLSTKAISAPCEHCHLPMILWEHPHKRMSRSHQINFYFLSKYPDMPEVYPWWFIIRFIYFAIHQWSSFLHKIPAESKWNWLDLVLMMCHKSTVK